MKKTDFSKALTEYFSTYLPATCGVSPNTSNSYRDAFKLLLLFLREEKHIDANRIELHMLSITLVSEFLNWLEVSRNVSATTRNQRLAAIKAFAHFVQYRYPEYMENCIDNANQGLKAREGGRKTAQKSRECKYVANKSHNTLLRCLRQ